MMMMMMMMMMMESNNKSESTKTSRLPAGREPLRPIIWRHGYYWSIGVMTSMMKLWKLKTIRKIRVWFLLKTYRKSSMLNRMIVADDVTQAIHVMVSKLSMQHACLLRRLPAGHCI